MSTAVTQIDTGQVTTPEGGFGALATEKGNLPLDQLDVRLAVTGLAVETELTQGFRNPYDEPLEATYVFPLPDRAAVTSLTMTADDRTVHGVLREREQARADYEQAIGEGKRASLAEEERPGVFTMRVGNILPGERVSIRLTLAGRLEYETGSATLRFPLVVAPRYIPGAPLSGTPVGSGTGPDTDAVPDASRITPPVLLPGFPSPVELSIRADIDPAGLPLAEVASSLHPIATEDVDGKLRVRVHPGERADRDFILRLRLGADDTVTSSLVTVPDQEGDEGTYVLTVLPPNGTALPRPRDVVFVLDRSGSMRGRKMVAARRATARMVDTLNGGDRFAVLAFDNVVETPPELPDGLVSATDRHRFRAVEHLSQLSGRGGTEMLRPLLRAAELLAGDEDADRERALVLVTDGQVGNEDQILHELAARLPDVRVHTVGVDVAVNEAFLRRLATLGGGHYELVESEDRLDEAMEAIHRRIGLPLVTDLAIAADGLDLVAGSTAPEPLPALYAGAALVVTGRYDAAASAPGGERAVTVSGRAAGGDDWSERLPARTGDNPALGAVWARARLRDLEDRYVAAGGHRGLAELEREIVDISVRFGVLCRFTAYVAIDSRVVNEGGTQRRVTQPVELPQGWDPAALGAPPVASAASRRGPGLAAAGGVRRAFAQPTAAPLAYTAARPERAERAEAVESGTTVPPGPPAPPAEPAELREARTRAAELLRTVLDAEAAERRSRLAALLDQLESVLAELERAGVDALVLRPLRQLADELRAYGRRELPSAAETERLWVRATDVLRAFAETDAGPEPGVTLGQRRRFWKRSG